MTGAGGSVLAVATAPGHEAHDTGSHHPERPSRIGAALRGLADAGLVEAALQLGPRAATASELERVHSPQYLAALKVFCQSGGGHLDPDTPAVPGSWTAALHAAGAGLAAVDSLRAGEADVALVASRPPGHHALRDRAMGFCLLNNIAVAAAALAADGQRVAIVDWDVHHGNGTQAVFWNDDRVLYVSTHQMPLFPGTGALEEVGGPDATGLILNVPLPPAATGDVVLRAIDEVVAPEVEAFAPDWVLVSAGFDAHRADPLAGLHLSAGDFADLARRVAGFGPGRGRLVLFLEGGYDLDALRLSVGATLAALVGSNYRPEAATGGGPGLAAVERARLFRLSLGSRR
ncbi:MAG TPA: histone deacetylase [Acidimicrobiales bacterium]|nr:histone deacetylase [Acidimicrobiales bacterium]